MQQTLVLKTRDIEKLSLIDVTIKGIGIVEAFSREGTFFWFLLEISTAFGTYCSWDK